MHNALDTSGENLDIYGYPFTSVNGYLSTEMLDQYGAIFDQAEAAVAEQPEYLARVQTARLPQQYVLLEQAKVNGTQPRGFFQRGTGDHWKVRPEMEALLDTFVVRCNRAHIEILWEGGTSPEEYLASTRKYLAESMQPHLALYKPVNLAAPASQKYHNGDKSALTDGLKGNEDYHMNWLGFEGEDMEATIDLGSVQQVQSLRTDFLQDINSWVFMPPEVTYSLSRDGKNFRSVAEVKNTIPENQNGALTAPFQADFKPIKARFVRVYARSLKTCPLWHKGAGGPAWIFADEIVVR
jgi:hypothetical protein